MNLITLLLLDDIKIPRKIQKDIEKMFWQRIGRNKKGSKKRKDLKSIENLQVSLENFGVKNIIFNLPGDPNNSNLVHTLGAFGFLDCTLILGKE